MVTFIQSVSLGKDKSLYMYVESKDDLQYFHINLYRGVGVDTLGIRQPNNLLKIFKPNCGWSNFLLMGEKIRSLFFKIV